MNISVDRLEWLTTKLIEGELTTDEAQELDELLQSSPEARAAFYESTSLDSLMADDAARPCMHSPVPVSPSSV